MSDESTFDWDETFYSLQYNTESRGKILKDLRVKEGYEMHRTLNKNDNGCHYSYKKLKKGSPRGRNEEYAWQININDYSSELQERFGKRSFWNFIHEYWEHRGEFKSTNGKNYFVITKSAKPATKRKSKELSSKWKHRVEKGIKYAEKMMNATDNIEKIRRQKRRRQKRRRYEDEDEDEEDCNRIYHPAHKRRKTDINYGF